MVQSIADCGRPLRFEARALIKSTIIDHYLRKTDVATSNSLDRCATHSATANSAGVFRSPLARCLRRFMWESLNSSPTTCFLLRVGGVVAFCRPIRNGRQTCAHSSRLPSRSASTSTLHNRYIDVFDRPVGSRSHTSSLGSSCSVERTREVGEKNGVIVLLSYS